MKKPQEVKQKQQQQQTKKSTLSEGGNIPSIITSISTRFITPIGAITIVIIYNLNSHCIWTIHTCERFCCVCECMQRTFRINTNFNYKIITTFKQNKKKKQQIFYLSRNCKHCNNTESTHTSTKIPFLSCLWCKCFHLNRTIYHIVQMTQLNNYNIYVYDKQCQYAQPHKSVSKEIFWKWRHNNDMVIFSSWVDHRQIMIKFMYV